MLHLNTEAELCMAAGWHVATDFRGNLIRRDFGPMLAVDTPQAEENSA